MTNKPILVELSRVKASDNKEQLVPKVTLGDFASRGSSQPDMRGELDAFAARYQEMIDRCKAKVDIITKQKAAKARIDPLLFWETGDYILRYLRDERSRGKFALNDIYGHLSRDLSLSTSSLEKILTFRRRFAAKDTVDPSKGWTYYRDAAYQKPVSAPREGKLTRNAVVMLRLRVPPNISLEGLDSQLKRWIHEKKDMPLTPAELLAESGIEIEDYEAFYGRESRSE